MKTVLVTGAKGFIGKNLCLALRRLETVDLIECDVEMSEAEIRRSLEKAAVVFHLAGVNRPLDPGEFETGNHGFTSSMLRMLANSTNRPVFVLSSSTQAVLDNPYGASKLEAERDLFKASEELGFRAIVYRLTNVFGKWCRPFYNSVIATFCHQATHGLELRVDAREKRIEFVHVDDVVRAFLGHLDEPVTPARVGPLQVNPVHDRTLGEIADLIEAFRDSRKTCVLPDFSDDFVDKLYSTYLSYLDPSDIAYCGEKKEDNRGYLCELLKNRSFGQMFISRTLPGITRGNHFHDSKVEKFCVVEGEAEISFRHVVSGDRFKIRVEGRQCTIIDIPPGYSHNIKNVGTCDLVTLFWANEIFDPTSPDTYFLEV